MVALGPPEDQQHSKLLDLTALNVINNNTNWIAWINWHRKPLGTFSFGNVGISKPYFPSVYGFSKFGINRPVTGM